MIELATGALQWLALTSLKGSLLIVAVLVLRRLLGNRLPPRLLHALWVIVLLRLLIPVAPGFELSVLGLPALRELSAAAAAPLPVGAMLGAALLLTAWLLGALVFGLRLAARNRGLDSGTWTAVRDPEALAVLDRCRRELGYRRRVPLLRWSLGSTPAVAGILSPFILLPNRHLALDEQRLRFVLLHELAHLKRRDLLLGLLAEAVLVLHWFNPLVRLAVRCMAADRELAADRAVLDHLPSHEHRAYGHSILDVVEQSSTVAHPVGLLVGLGRGLGELRRRLTAIRDASDRGPGATVLGWAGFAVVVGLFATDPLGAVLPAPTPLLSDTANRGAEDVRDAPAPPAALPKAPAPERALDPLDPDRAAAAEPGNSPGAALEIAASGEGLLTVIARERSLAAWTEEARGWAAFVLGADSPGSAARSASSGAANPAPGARGGAMGGGLGGGSFASASEPCVGAECSADSVPLAAAASAPGLSPPSGGASSGPGELTDPDPGASPDAAADPDSGDAWSALPDELIREAEDIAADPRAEPAPRSGSGGPLPPMFVDGADPGCEDGGYGPADRPHCTLQSAVDAAGPGGVVYVAPGRYDSVRVDGDLSLIAMAVPGGGAPEIRGAGPEPAVTVLEGARLSLRGFAEISGGLAPGKNVAALRVERGARLLLAHSFVDGGTGGDTLGLHSSGTVLVIESGIWGGNAEQESRALLADAGLLVLIGNEVDGGAGRGGAAALHSVGAARVQGFNNLFRAGGAEGERGAGALLEGAWHGLANNLFEARAGSAALIARLDRELVLINNQIDGSFRLSTGLGVNLVGAVDDSEPRWSMLHNNFAVDAPLPPELGSVDALNGCSWNGCREAAGNLSAPAGFLDPAAGDYRLREASPCVDSGIDPRPWGIAVPHDRDFDARPLDGDNDGIPRFDIGPDELRPVFSRDSAGDERVEISWR